jgi:hypothetical protein
VAGRQSRTSCARVIGSEVALFAYDRPPVTLSGGFDDGMALALDDVECHAEDVHHA